MKTCTLCDAKHMAKGLCAKHYKMQWHVANRDAMREKKKAYIAANLARERARTSAWRIANRAKMLAGMKAYYAATDPEKSRKARAEWYAENKKKVRADAIAWNAANRESVRAFQSAYKARKRGAEGRHTGEEVIALFARQKGCCAACRNLLPKNYHKDHIIPLSAGGSNWIQNIQLLCVSCNTSKRAKDSISFMRSRGFLL